MVWRPTGHWRTISFSSDSNPISRRLHAEGTMLGCALLAEGQRKHIFFLNQNGKERGETSQPISFIKDEDFNVFQAKARCILQVVNQSPRSCHLQLSQGDPGTNYTESPPHQSLSAESISGTEGWRKEVLPPNHYVWAQSKHRFLLLQGETACQSSQE